MRLRKFRFSTEASYLLELNPELWRVLSIEGDDGQDGAGGGDNQGGDADQADQSDSSDADDGTQSDQQAEPTWRDGLTDDAKKFAESSPDVNHAMGRAVDLQKKVSQGIFPPGENAKPEEIAAYQKRIGVPETAEGYEVSRPEHMAEDLFNSEPVQDRLKLARERLHAVNAPDNVVKTAIDTYFEIEAASQQAQMDADKVFADESEAALRKDWAGEYDVNKEHAERAAEKIFGTDTEEFRGLESRDGRFFADHPVMIRALAAVGREMQEAGIVPTLSPSDAAAVDEQLRGVRDKIKNAQGRGDSKEANRLYVEEQALIGKTKGNQPIVGAAGRAA